jgi:hypothetical protein
MKIVILQPGYLPWLGFFAMVHECDQFVFFDDVQFTIKDWRTRNRIRNATGWQWLIVPVTTEGSYTDYVIKDVKISYAQDWRKKHLKAFELSYRKARFFEEVFPILEEEISKSYKYLIDLDVALIYKICKYLGIYKEGKFIFSSALNAKGKKTERLIDILKKIRGAQTLISGMKAKDYLNEEEMRRCGFDVVWFSYSHPFYNQRFMHKDKTFISYLSIVDLLFVHGKESVQILTGKLSIKPPEDVRIISADEYKK